MTHGGHNPSGIDGNHRDCFGMIVDIAYYGRSGHVVCCVSGKAIPLTRQMDNKAWMKPSDVWVVQDIVVKNNQRNEKHFELKMILWIQLIPSAVEMKGEGRSIQRWTR